MKKLLATLILLPAWGWSAYIPVNGSTLNVANVTSTVGVQGIGPFVVTGSTLGAQQNGTWTVQPGNTPNTTAWLVQASSFGANASTVAVTNPAGNSLTVNITSGSISNTGFNVNNTPTVNPGNTQNTVPWNTQSTYTVVTDTWNVPVGQGGTWTVQPGNTPNTVPWNTQSTYTVITDTWAPPVSPALAQNLPGNNGSAFSQGANVRELILTKSGLQGVWSGPDITYNGYSASTGTYSVNNTTQDVAGLCGNATTTLYVYRVTAACTQTTAGIIPIAITKRSSAYTGSWSSATAVLQDSNYAAYTSTPVFNFGQNATNGTLIAYVDFGQIGCMAAGTATPNDIYVSPASWRMKPIVLRGTAQCLGINFQGATITGGKYSFGYDWLELSTSP